MTDARWLPLSLAVLLKEIPGLTSNFG